MITLKTSTYFLVAIGLAYLALAPSGLTAATFELSTVEVTEVSLNQDSAPEEKKGDPLRAAQTMAAIFIMIICLIVILHLCDFAFGTNMVRKKARQNYYLSIGGFFLFFGFAMYFDTPKTEENRIEDTTQPQLGSSDQTQNQLADVNVEQPCWSDPSCWANEHLLTAERACDDLIEDKVKALGWDDIQWTNSWFTPIFQSYSVQEPKSDDPMDRPFIRYSGNSISYTNIRGQTRQMEYTCTYDPVFKQILSVSLG